MFSLAAALILDAIFGEPRWLWSRVAHPAVLMGRMIAWGDATFNNGPDRRFKGALFILALSAVSLGFGWLITALPIAWLWEILIAAILIAQRSLMDHARAVADGLRYSLPEGRQAVAMIVGRDTGDMDGPAIARAAIESTGENFSDGVIAPAFWFAALGLPGIVFYKAVNTADSMIGHRTERYREFGWAAARLDDVLNWVPARLTAALIALAHADHSAWQSAKIEAPRHRSPNAGWPEAALARTLGTALSGPRSYGGKTEHHPFVNATGRHDLGPGDIDAACKALWGTWRVFLTIVMIIGLASLILN